MIESDILHSVLSRLEDEEKQLADSGAKTNWIVDRVGAEWIFTFLQKHQPQLIMECGTSVGYSTIWLAAAAAGYGGEVISIEKDPHKHEIAKQNIQTAQVQVELLIGDAEVVLKNWNNKKIDFLFLDANKKGYLPQFLAAEPHLSKSAVVIADNVIDMAKRVDDFVQCMKQHPHFEVTIETIGDGLLVARKKELVA